jgi:hypothetical protein
MFMWVMWSCVQCPEISVGDRGDFSKPGRRNRPNQACVPEIPGRRDPAPGFGLSSTQLLSRSRQAARQLGRNQHHREAHIENSMHETRKNSAHFALSNFQPQAESGGCVVLSGHLAAMMGPLGRPGGVCYSQYIIPIW